MKFYCLTFLIFSLFKSPRSYAATSEQETVFAGWANHLVAAYETWGEVDAHYDETGYCGDGCSIWELVSQNQSIKYHLDNFESLRTPGVSGPLAGRYKGRVSFRLQEDPLNEVTLLLDLVYSGEDITVSVSKSDANSSL